MKIDALKMAVLAVFAGSETVLTGKEIAALCIQAKPDVNIGSLNIADSVASDRQSRQYASHILVRVSGGYKVLPRAEWRVLEASGRTASKQTLSDAADSVARKLAALQAETETANDAELEALTAPSN